jgi:hypothetical protein
VAVLEECINHQCELHGDFILPCVRKDIGCKRVAVLQLEKWARHAISMVGLGSFGSTLMKAMMWTRCSNYSPLIIF